jgi:hypothetical protein
VGCIRHLRLRFESVFTFREQAARFQSEHCRSKGTSTGVN